MRLAIVLIVALALTGCATLAGSPGRSLLISTLPDSVEVSTDEGVPVGTTPFDAPLRLGSGTKRLDFARPGWEGTSVHLDREVSKAFVSNFLLPAAGIAARVLGARGAVAFGLVGTGLLGAAVDIRAGAIWRHVPSTISVELLQLPITQLPIAPADSAALIGATLEALARTGEAVGCDSVFIVTWLEERELYRTPVSLTPAQQEMVNVNVAAAQASLQIACEATASAAGALRDGMRTVNASPPGDLMAPVYFPFASASVPDSVIPRLTELGQRISTARPVVNLVIQGFADPIGAREFNDVLGRARAEAVLAIILSAADLDSECCSVVSYGSAPEWQAMPGAARDAPGAAYNRRVTFVLHLVEEG